MLACGPFVASVATIDEDRARPRVTLGGKDFCLGRYGTRESREAYQRLIGEYVAGHGRPPATAGMTVAGLTAAYKRFAKSFYVTPDGT